MADLLLLATVVGFFAAMVLLIRACDGVLGPEPRGLHPGGDAVVAGGALPDDGAGRATGDDGADRAGVAS